MLRVVRLTKEKSQSVFDKFWEGFVIGVRKQQEIPMYKPDKAIARIQSKIGRKLKAASVESDRKLAGNLVYRNLDQMECELKFEQQELDELINLLESTPWLPEHLDDAYDAIDFLNAADRVD